MAVFELDHVPPVNVFDKVELAPTLAVTVPVIEGIKPGTKLEFVPVKVNDERLPFNLAFESVKVVIPLFVPLMIP
jgi:hypothetical protein